MSTTYTVTGHVIGTESHHGLSGLRVELWDSFYHVTSVIDSMTTTSDGGFSFSFTDTEVNDIFGAHTPMVHFRIYDGSTLKMNTDGSVTWLINDPSFNIIDLGDLDLFVTDEGTVDYVVNGIVHNFTTSHGASHVRLELRDAGHASASPAYTVETDERGYFQYAISLSHLHDLYGGTIPTFYFQAANLAGTVVGSTEGGITWAPSSDANSGYSLGWEFPDQSYTISGHLNDAETGNGVGGLRVEMWDADHGVATAVIAVDGNDDGAFEITLSDSVLAAYFGTGIPRLYFKVFSGSTLLASTEGSQEWTTDTPDATVDITIPSEEGGDGDAPVTSTERGCGAVAVATYSMNGTISSIDRAGMAGLEVRIYDKGIGGDFLLASGVADNCGNFNVNFDASQVADRGKLRPDVQIKVYSDGTLVGSSDVRYNAFGNETINVDVPANPAGLKSEHEVLLGALSTHYDGALRDLQEDDDQQDITFLANKSGWDARAVAMAAMADQFSTGSAHPDGSGSIDPSFFYALFRAGLPANENILFHTDETALTTIWQKAVGQGMISAARTADIPAVVARFKELSGDQLLTSAPVIGVSGMGDMLTSSGLNSTQRQQFTQLYAQHASDPATLWSNVEATFGAGVANRLQVDGKLAFLTLNNAQLMTAVHSTVGTVTDTLQLAQEGYHSADQWTSLIGEDTPVPNEIPGETEEEKRRNYAEYMAAQVRMSYPTASVAQMVASGALPVEASSETADFLSEHQEQFQIGLQPVEQYIAQNELTVDANTVAEISRLQRVYQITPSDSAMAGLLNNGLDAAAHVVRYDRDAFIETFAADLGGQESAAKVHDRSVQIHNAVINVALSYLTASRGIPLGNPPLSPDSTNADSERQFLQPAPKGPGSVNITDGGPYALGGPLGSGSHTDDVLAYPTLESLLGKMDFCSCDECRSVLSPAAYLVDLLHFIDNTSAAPMNPQTVLFNRRPDIQHIPLTCENTNTAMPYIDLVNEVLEYYVANTLSLTGYVGHDTGTMKSEDLLASPAFVMDAAYTLLATRYFPLNLPFHQPLENLRRHFQKFEVPLTVAMERLRPNNNLERGSSTYGWRDTLMEELGISRAEYDIFTNITIVPLWKMFGFPTAITDTAVISGVTNAKDYCRRVGITYEELAQILQARFVNPSADLIPKLERLGVPFSTLKALNDHSISVTTFNNLLPTGALAPDPAQYGGNIANWVVDPQNFGRIMSLILLTDTGTAGNPCSFDTLELRKATNLSTPGYTTGPISAADHIRILRFIRMWKKLGWTIEQTDAALCALYRTDFQWITYNDVSMTALLDNGFATLLPRLGVVARVMRELNLSVKRDLQAILSWWSLINPTMSNSIYTQMFLNPTILAQDGVYADNGYGVFLSNPSERVLAHTESLRAAFGLTGEEFNQIADALGYISSTPMQIVKITEIFRRGHLARALKISVQELLLLMRYTGIDPFTTLDPTGPAVIKLARLVRSLKEASLKPATALYLIWNQDLSGSSNPTTAQINEFMRALRDDFSKIEKEFAISDDPTGEIAQLRMTLAYGTEATGFFFGLLNETFVSEVNYSYYAPAFGPALAALIASEGGTYGDPARPRLAYDAFKKRMTFTGVMTESTWLGLRDLPFDSSVTAEITADAPPGSLPIIQAEFQAAIDTLYEMNSAVIDPFFARYTELPALYNMFTTMPATLDVKRTILLENFLPALIAKRKYQQVFQRLADAAQTDRASAEALVNPSPISAGLHAENDPLSPALNDLLTVETEGLDVQFYSGIMIGANPHTPEITADLAYGIAGSSNALPTNMVDPMQGISATWSGYVEVPSTAAYTIFVDTEASATVTMQINGSPILLVHSGGLWHNVVELPLAGGTLYPIVISVENVFSYVRIQWQTLGHGLTPIPAPRLYPSTILGLTSRTYLRFLKASALATALKLTAAEVARPQLVGGTSWLNALPVLKSPVPNNLFAPLTQLLDYAAIKGALSPGSTQLLDVMSDLSATPPSADSLLKLSGWDRASLDALVARFAGSVDYSYLRQTSGLRAVFDAFELVKTMGISATALIAATTNEPTATLVRDFQSALRARFTAEDWRDVVRPINDQMRSLRRDALVSYILHQLRSDPATRHVDTPEKLFEYFLMDVEMEPCMQTSRIRHALSSVQLFIERSLMSLEHNVSSSSLSGKQWEWMKRYRVWEANRKVFLYPENWLEPELRDDKSPFFKEIESELLQSDVTEESATMAMLNYLARLEEVAKLEPVGFHHIPADPVRPTAEINHVVARTPGAHRKYYYRRREFGYWTSWEQIKLDIEDNPVVPVIWKNRLLLLWLKVIKGGPDTATGTKPSGQHPGDDLKNLSLPTDPKTKVYVVLCWSEYYNGKWQEMKTSDLEHPSKLGEFLPTAPFERRDLVIRTEPEGDGLRINVSGSGNGNATFLMYNTHSTPSQAPRSSFNYAVMMPQQSRRIGDALVNGVYTGDMSFSYSNGMAVAISLSGSAPVSNSLDRKILRPSIPFSVILPTHPLADTWNVPLFYQDKRHVFYVSSEQEQIFIRDYSHYGITARTGPASSASLPALVGQGTAAATAAAAAPATSWVTGTAASSSVAAAETSVVSQFVTEDANIRQALGTTSYVTYGTRQIGPVGTISAHL